MKSKDQATLELLYVKESSDVTGQENLGARAQEPDWWTTVFEMAELIYCFHRYLAIWKKLLK